VMIALILSLIMTIPCPGTDIYIHSRDFSIHQSEGQYVYYCVMKAKDMISRDTKIIKITLKFQASWQPRIGHWAKEERVNCAFYIFRIKRLNEWVRESPQYDIYKIMMLF